MRVLEENLKKGYFKLASENLDDLWHLYNLIAKGDMVTSKTTREIKVEREELRPTQGKRVPMVLVLRVEDVFFDRNFSKLRVRGPILEAPEKYEGLLGAYHTFTVPENGTLSVTKERWYDSHLKRIKTATTVRTQPILIVAIDDEEVAIALLGRFGFDLKLEEPFKLPGKREPEQRALAMTKQLKKIAEALHQAWVPLQCSIVIVGPGFVKEDLARYLRNNHRDLAPSILQVAGGSFAGSAGVNEALRSGVLTPVFKKSRVVEEANLVERFLGKLGSEAHLATYGVEGVEKAASYGAIETLLVVDRTLREAPDEVRERLEDAMRTAEQRGGKVVVLSGEHEGGEKILSFGGMAGTLRFPV